MPDDEFRILDPIDPLGTGPNMTGFDRLHRDGVDLRAPGEINPDQISGCLWELIYALAARRVFLCHTDHLDDAGLYAWLHDEWLPRPSPFAPDDWNVHVDVLGTGTDADNENWLRYYADDVLRGIWARDFPEDPLPASEAAPFDRDRWLPQPTAPTPAEPEESRSSLRSDNLAGSSFDELHDPLRLEAVDLELHREPLIFDTDESETGFDDSYGDAEAPASVEELLLEPAVDVETRHWRNPHAELMASGIILPPPEELTDDALRAKLWELFHELACRGFYLLHTDHLGDRRLYTILWREHLHEPAILPGKISGGGWYFDFIGSDGTEDVVHWLRYYANDLEREEYAMKNPGHALPRRERCPFNRDRRLPKGPI